MNSLKNMISENSQYIYDVVEDYLKCNNIESWINLCCGCDYENCPTDVVVRAGAKSNT